MDRDDRFAHGSYGDDSGIVLLASLPGGSSSRLLVSDKYVDPLFNAVLDSGRRPAGDPYAVPRVVRDWDSMSGCFDSKTVRQTIAAGDAEELALALGSLSGESIAPHVLGPSAADCLQCAAAIAHFLRAAVEAKQSLEIEDD